MSGVITDVGGVRVAHLTLDHGADVRTGVTCVLPHVRDLVNAPVTAAAHVVNDSAAWDNALHGFTESGNAGALLLRRTTSYANGADGYYFPTSGARLEENLAVANRAGKATGGDAVFSWNNNWDAGVGTPAFASTDDAAVRGGRWCSRTSVSAPSAATAVR